MKKGTPTSDTKETKPTGWGAARKHLSGWDQAALLALVKDLYDTSSANRNFIQARCQAAVGGGDVLESYRSKVVEPFFPKRGHGKLKMAEARKAIREYKKATGSILGTAELLMTFVENGVAFSTRYGSINERFYSSVGSGLSELAELLTREGREFYPQFRERLAEVKGKTGYMGWGFHDFVCDVVAAMRKELEGSSQAMALLKQHSIN